MQETQVAERLARIETIQEGIKEQLDNVVKLLDRMVRVEEKTNTLQGELNNIKKQSQKNAIELDKWKSARLIILWIGGALTTVSIALTVAYLKELFFG